MGRKQTEQTRRRIGRGVRKTAARKRRKRQRLDAEDQLVGAFRGEVGENLTRRVLDPSERFQGEG